MKITAIVVLYNSTLEQSATISSLLNCSLENIQFNLIIWNNGPNLLDSTELFELENIASGKNMTLSIHQSINNIALSKIYNYFIDRELYDFFTILDHDSSLNEAFFQNIVNHSEYDLIVPKIVASGWRTTEETICFPTYINSIKVLDKAIFTTNEIFTISSGITLSLKLIQYVKHYQPYAFNENFALYGIDTCFFKDLYKMDLNNSKGICIGSINHNLATSQLDNTNISQSRKLELGYDTILQRIYCKRKSTTSSSFFLIKSFLKGQYSFEHTIKLFSCLLAKKHPRAKILLVE